MADDKSKTGQDRKLISLKEDYEVRAWCKTTLRGSRQPSQLSAIRRIRFVSI
jgi:hypothetical protein